MIGSAFAISYLDKIVLLTLSFKPKKEPPTLLKREGPGSRPTAVAWRYAMNSERITQLREKAQGLFLSVVGYGVKFYGFSISVITLSAATGCTCRW